MAEKDLVEAVIRRAKALKDLPENGRIKAIEYLDEYIKGLDDPNHPLAESEIKDTLRSRLK